MKNNKNSYYITVDDISARSTPGAVKVLEGSSGGKMPNITEISIQRRFFRPSEVKGLVAVLCALHSTPEGQNIIILSRQGQNFKMITSAKHEGYISVWARVRSTRVPNIIHHEGRGCKAYKDKRDRSFKILRYF